MIQRWDSHCLQWPSAVGGLLSRGRTIPVSITAVTGSVPVTIARPMVFGAITTTLSAAIAIAGTMAMPRRMITPASRPIVYTSRKRQCAQRS